MPGRDCAHSRRQPVWGGVLSRCDDCGLVATAQVPHFEYSADYFLGGEHGYDFDSPVSRALDAARFEQELDRLAARGLAGSVLDVGCAVGAFLAHARQRGWEIAGVEVADFARNEASRRLGIDVKRDLGALPPGQRYDVVTLHHVLEHLANPAEFLARDVAPRVDRLLLIEVPNFASLGAQADGPAWEDLRPEQHVHHFEPGTLRAVVEAAGFEVVAVYTRMDALFSLYAGRQMLWTLRALGRSRRFGPADLPPPRHGVAPPDWAPPQGLRAAGLRAVHLAFIPLIRWIEQTNRGSRLVLEAQPAPACR